MIQRVMMEALVVDMMKGVSDCVDLAVRSCVGVRMQGLLETWRSRQN